MAAAGKYFLSIGLECAQVAKGDSAEVYPAQRTWHDNKNNPAFDGAEKVSFFLYSRK
jgi:hypothetical protein